MFSIVSTAEVGIFLGLSCFFDDPVDVGNLISGSSAFSKSSLNIWKFTVQVLSKPGFENFEHYFASMWDECNCAIVREFFGVAFLWNWLSSVPKRWCQRVMANSNFPQVIKNWIGSQEFFLLPCLTSVQWVFGNYIWGKQKDNFGPKPWQYIHRCQLAETDSFKFPLSEILSWVSPS